MLRITTTVKKVALSTPQDEKGVRGETSVLIRAIQMDTCTCADLGKVCVLNALVSLQVFGLFSFLAY